MTKQKFAQLGIVEEVGKGTRTMFKYVPLISGGQKHVIEKKDEIKVMIPCLMARPTAITTETILRIIGDNPKITSNLTSDGIFYHTRKLKQQRELIREGGCKNGHWIVAKNDNDINPSLWQYA